MNQKGGIMKDYVSDCLVRDLANRDPRIRQVLEQLGIDTCCGGGRNLYDAMREAGITGDQLNRSIELAMQEADEPEKDWTGSSTKELLDCIVKIHHRYLYGKLPMLEEWFRRVLEAHAAHREHLLPLQQTFLTIRNDLFPHLKQEETELFPELENGSGEPEKRKKLIEKMESEHTAVGEALKHLRKESRGYEYPEYACDTVRLLFDGLGEMDDMLREHIYLENNVLFPRFL